MKIRLDQVSIWSPNSKWHQVSTNVLLADGVLAAIGDDTPEADRVINATGSWLSAGWVDLRAQFGDPGEEHREDLESGCAAAAAGGFTHVALLPNTTPVVQTKNAVKYLKEGNATRVTQVLPLAAVTLETKGEDFTDMLDLHRAGAMGFTDGTHSLWHTDILLKSLLYLQKVDGLLMTRPEDRMLAAFGLMHEGINSTVLGMPGIPRMAETLMIDRDLQLLEYAGGRLHFSTISTAEGVEKIRQAKSLGMRVSCDVAAHQLIWTDADLEGFDTNLKVSPPLREARDIEALIEGIADGTVDAIVSNHNPQDQEGKKLEFDLANHGQTGLEMVLPMMRKLGNKVTMDTWLPAVTTGPRKLLGLETPGFEIGTRADFTWFDMNAQWKYDGQSSYSKCSNHPWYGQEVKGKVLGSFFENRAFIAEDKKSHAQ